MDGMAINSISPWCQIYASVNRVGIGSDNGLPPIQRQVSEWVIKFNGLSRTAGSI